MARGGKREGAGRKKFGTTKPVRLPIELIEELDKLGNHKDLIINACKLTYKINLSEEKMYSDTESNIYIKNGKLVIPQKEQGTGTIMDIQSSSYDRETEIADFRYFVILPDYFEHEIYRFKEENEVYDALIYGVDSEPLKNFSGLKIIDNEMTNYEINDFFQ